jgi:hypothetical protein
MGFNSGLKGLMMCKAKVAVCSEIRKKTLNAKRAPSKIFEY